MILSTDPTFHFSDLNQFNLRLNQKNFAPDKEDKMLCLKIMLHSADISSAGRNWDVAKNWSARVL